MTLNQLSSSSPVSYTRSVSTTGKRLFYMRLLKTVTYTAWHTDQTLNLVKWFCVLVWQYSYTTEVDEYRSTISVRRRDSSQIDYPEDLNGTLHIYDTLGLFYTVASFISASQTMKRSTCVVCFWQYGCITARWVDRTAVDVTRLIRSTGACGVRALAPAASTRAPVRTTSSTPVLPLTYTRWGAICLFLKGTVHLKGLHLFFSLASGHSR